MSKNLFLLTGEIGSGKSTAAGIFKKYGFYEDFFARPLKEFALLIGFKYEEIYGTQEQKLQINEFWGISGREFLQKFGSEVCRDFLPTAIPVMKFCNRTLWARRMEQVIINKSNLVISDGRFPDEAKLVKDYNGIIIRIERFYDTKDKSVSTHKSELEMKNIKPDIIINNNGSIESLESAIIEILKKYSYTFPTNAEIPVYNTTDDTIVNTTSDKPTTCDKATNTDDTTCETADNIEDLNIVVKPSYNNRILLIRDSNHHLDFLAEYGM